MDFSIISNHPLRLNSNIYLIIYLNIFPGLIDSWGRELRYFETPGTIHPMTEHRIQKTLILTKAAVIISDLTFVYFPLILTLRHSRLSQRYEWFFNCHVLLLKIEELSPFETSVTICRVNIVVDISECLNIRFFNSYYLLTYLLTYSMEQSPSWEANQ
jgi:hypothetical protein